MSKQGFEDNWHWLLIIGIAIIGVIFIAINIFVDDDEGITDVTCIQEWSINNDITSLTIGYLKNISINSETIYNNMCCIKSSNGHFCVPSKGFEKIEQYGKGKNDE